jgi:membrane protein
VRSIIEFMREWYKDAARPLRRADPLLMGAAFAYNALFAAVPLALAFVSVLTLLDSTQQVLSDIYRFIGEKLPPDIAEFMTQILSESVEVVEDNRAFIIVVTLLVALWSGSRAVYTLQKALRLVDNSDYDLGYVQMRSIGILVTVAAGIGIFAAYAVVAAGIGLLGRLAPDLPDALFVGELIVVGIAILWVFALLFAIYQWGAPQPVRRPAATAALVTAVLLVGTWIAINLVPSGSAASIAVFGTMGLILVWLYGVGIVLVSGPIAVGSLLRALEK